MTREWQPEGSNYDFWRSDNPLIQGWWRFGDDKPKNNYQTPEEQGPNNYLSGVVVDSGPQKHHLKPFYVPTDDVTLIPVQGIAPWASTGSGLKFNWNNATTTDRRAALYADPSTFTEAVQGTQGSLCVGTNLYSGLTVIGWCQVPERVPHNTTVGPMIGRHNSNGGALSNWTINWQQAGAGGPYVIQALHRMEENFTFPTPISEIIAAVVRSDTFPYFPSDRTQPFFVALQIRREAEETNRSFTSAGSGTISIFAGTAESGITCWNTALYIGPGCQSHQPYQASNFEFTFGGNSNALVSATATNGFVPSGTILDEFIYVADGTLSPDRILHYALSGLRYIETSNPESSGFVPEFPGSDGLVAFWSFDDDTGTNSSPNTLGDPRLELSLSGLGSAISFVDGVNEGRAIRVTPTNTLSHGQDGGAFLATKDYPCIPAQSGLELLFPSGQNMDEGMTIIGWMRSVPTGTNLGGGGFGWMGATGRHNMFAVETLNTTISAANRNVVSCSHRASGVGGAAPVPNFRFVSRVTTTTSPTSNPGHQIGLSNSTAGTIPYFDTSDDGWHLWAGVFDLKAGQMYMVRDAKHLIQLTQQISSASGWNSDGLGVDEGFFGLMPIIASRSVEFDEFAVYNRILSIPEMSGFGLASINTIRPGAVLSTPMRSLVGSWPLSGFVSYGTSQQRLNDNSWYRHHLTNVSGGFTVGTKLNPESTAVNGALRSSVSGSMISLERVFHGANLDASTSNLFSTSGLSAGTWLYLPSGDLSTEGNGSSGLYGDHMIMGAWSSVASECSWFLGIRDNKAHVKFYNDSATLSEFTATDTVPFNAPFFIGCQFFPSGGLYIRAQVVQATMEEQTAVQYVIDQSFGLSSDVPNSVGASGFSLLNVPNLQYGFPQTTRIGQAFVHLGYMNEDSWLITKRSNVTNINLASGSVSTSDIENISHWRFDRAGKYAIDFGREQNHLYPINTDGHKMGVQAAYHLSGVVVRQQEYLDTIPSNPSSKRLDLGSGTQSWTMLGWLVPPVVSNTDEHVIMNKGSGPASSPTGIKVYTPADSLNLSVTSAGTEASAHNGDLAPGEWSHIAIVADRDNEQLAVIVNGRYAGTSFLNIPEVAVNNSGLSLGGRGDQEGNALYGGSAFSGILDDVMLFSRALTLPEISGLAANSYNFNEGAQSLDATIGMWISGIPQNIVSGLIGAYVHGQAQDIELVAGYVSGVSGVVSPYGGFIHGLAVVSGLTGGFTHGLASQSGIFGHFIHGLGIVSGLIGTYTFGATQHQDEFDVTLTFQIVTSEDFDARLGVEKTEIYDFDSKLGVIRITQPPACSIELPEVGLIASGVPYTLTAQGSGIAYENKKVSLVRFTFADFKGAEVGTLVDGVPFSGLYEASRTFDTPGWYTVKIEVLDSYGYRSSCARPFLLVPSGSTSGAYLATLPGISISGTPISGSTIHRAFLTHSLSGLDTTSGVLEYTDFADQQETLVNSLEMPSGTQFTDFIRTHDYTMPGHYVPVWAVSGSWGVVSDSLSDGIDYLG